MSASVARSTPLVFREVSSLDDIITPPVSKSSRRHAKAKAEPVVVEPQAATRVTRRSIATRPPSPSPPPPKSSKKAKGKKKDTGESKEETKKGKKGKKALNDPFPDSGSPSLFRDVLAGVPYFDPQSLHRMGTLATTEMVALFLSLFVYHLS